MKMRMISLSILTILTLCLLNVTAASTSTSITVPHSKVVPEATALQPTKITITNYPPKQVKVGQDFDVTGRLTAGNTGLGNKLVYHDYRDNNGTWWWTWNFTTNADGSFTDSFHYETPGTHYLSYYFDGDNQYDWCASDVMEITAVS
jgi:hypothetical protein